MSLQQDSPALFAPTVSTRPRLLAGLMRFLVARLHEGRLTVEMPDGTVIDRVAPEPGPHGVLVIHRWRAIRRLVVEGDIGFAEAYMDGDWSTPDLAALIEHGARNEARLGAGIRGLLLFRLLNRLRHLARPNSRRGSRRNITQHYDLGNEFYRQWLDPGMSYSSALYTDPAQTLEAAQTAKQDRAIELLDVTGGERVLEIGCGWGGLAERLVERDCHVTGLTLSPAQLEFAQQRLPQADLRLQDYRAVDGIFDRIVSIEMLEAVGEKYWPEYFEVLRQRLAPGGVAVLQVITIAASRFEQYRRGADFIQRHIFPGGMLPSSDRLYSEIERSGLALTHVENFGQSYARTLVEWRERFQRSWPAIQAQGFGQNFKRMWEYYLAYCEAGFRSEAIDVGFYRIEKAR